MAALFTALKKSVELGRCFQYNSSKVRFMLSIGDWIRE